MLLCYCVKHIAVQVFLERKVENVDLETGLVVREGWLEKRVDIVIDLT